MESPLIDLEFDRNLIVDTLSYFFFFSLNFAMVMEISRSDRRSFDMNRTSPRSRNEKAAVDEERSFRYLSPILFDNPAKVEFSEIEWRSRPCLIGRVEQAIRTGRDESFSPTVLSIGPLHHRNQRLKEVEALKDLILVEFWGTGDCPEDVSNFIREMVFCCYPKHIQDKYESDLDDFVNMCFKDASVALYVIDISANRMSSSILGRTTFEHCVTDVLLLENQLPLPLLNLLSARKFGKGKGRRNIMKFLYAAVNRRLSDSFPQLPEDFFDNALHLVDLLRQLCLMSFFPFKYPFFAFSAKELDGKGVKIVGIRPKANEGPLGGPMKFSWRTATLATPFLFVHDIVRFRKLFLNMIAFESTPGVKSKGEITTFIHVYAALLRDSVSVAISKEKFVSTRYDNETIVALFKEMSANSFTDFEIYATAGAPQFGFAWKLRVGLKEIYETCLKSPITVAFVLAVVAYIHLAKGKR